MRITLPLMIAAILLSACGGSQLTPERKAQIETSIAQNNAALSEAQNVTVNGKTFRVAHVTERNQALVDLVGASTPYFVADVEAASRAATGCNGSINLGVLALLGGDMATVDLAKFPRKSSGNFLGWSVTLAC